MFCKLLGPHTYRKCVNIHLLKSEYTHTYKLSIPSGFHGILITTILISMKKHNHLMQEGKKFRKSN